MDKKNTDSETAIVKRELDDITPVNNVQTVISYLNQEITPETIDDYIHIGQAARELSDISQWVIGRLAFEIFAKWQRGGLKDFCKGVGYQMSSVQKYRWVTEQYLDKYGELPIDSEGNLLQFSYYVVAAKSEDPLELIKKAQDERLTVRQLENLYQGKPIPSECKHKNTKVITICVDCGVRVD